MTLLNFFEKCALRLQPHKIVLAILAFMSVGSMAYAVMAAAKLEADSFLMIAIAGFVFFWIWGALMVIDWYGPASSEEESTMTTVMRGPAGRKWGTIFLLLFLAFSFVWLAFGLVAYVEYVPPVLDIAE